MQQLLRDRGNYVPAGQIKFIPKVESFKLTDMKLTEISDIVTIRVGVSLS
jgi:hypothetical protein